MRTRFLRIKGYKGNAASINDHAQLIITADIAFVTHTKSEQLIFTITLSVMDM